MSQPAQSYPGQWHGKQYYFGFHSDLHVDPDDHDIGKDCNVDSLVSLFRIIRPDFVQTDGKGHPGYTSWLSQVPGASVAPGIVKEPLVEWRKASKLLKLPLHVAYSGMFDKAAGALHPDWCLRDKDGHAVSTPGWYGPPDSGDKMCPRSPYVDELMIPQLMELIERYEVDGLWIDGDLWIMETCYCDRCRKAFKDKTGIVEPPRDPSDVNWSKWWNFTRESYEAYATYYCDAVHGFKPGVLIASNWIQGFRYPGKPEVPSDWISGDALAIGKDPFAGVDALRTDARFNSTRGKPWDIMLWCFYGAFHDTSTMKPIEMLQQQAATILAFGGNVQTCENPFIGLRAGKYAEWRARHLGMLRDFVKNRQALCQDTKTIPQVAVLHSEHHFRSVQKGKDLFFTVDIAAPRGATFSLLECQYGVDILDEWALLPQLNEYPVVVAPEQDKMSEEMVQALKRYVWAGGSLLVSGADSYTRFGEEFLGANAGTLTGENILYVPTRDASVAVKSAQWRFVDITTAHTLATIGETPLLDEQLLPNPAAIINQYGKGWVTYIPFDIFREFDRNHYPLVREFIKGVVRALSSPLDIEVKAPPYVDVILRKKDNQLLLHLINQSDGQIGDISRVGPVFITLKMPKRPADVSLAFENASLQWEYTEQGLLKIVVPHLHIHAAVIIDREQRVY